MSALFDGSTCWLKRTTNLPSVTAFTIMGWTYQTVDPMEFRVAYSFGQLTTPVYWVFVDASQIFNVYNGIAFLNLSTSISLNTWKHFSITVAGTGAGQVKSYVDGVADVTGDGNSLVTADALIIGCHHNGLDSFYPGRMSGLKVYSAVLSAAEVATEFGSFTPVRTANLNGFYDMTTAASVGKDTSGNGNDMTVTGSFVTAANPPIQDQLAPRLIVQHI